MSRRTFLFLSIGAFAVGAAVRVHNALFFPLMRGYDAFAHFGYVWFLAAERRVPEPTAGWEFFQPPAWYALMVLPWTLLGDLDPIARLRLGNAAVALLSLLPALVALRLVRRLLPGQDLAALLAAGLALFVPVHLYSAGFLGNEVFCAVLCSAALGVLAWTASSPTALRCVALGLVLGAAMLAKFTAAVVVAAALGTLGLGALRKGDKAGAARRVAVAAAAMLAVCGWFYARNLVEYGNPFQMSREEIFLSHIEDAQLQGRRTLAEYVLFDPLIVYRPQWPRGLSLDAPRPEGSSYSALRESIPTGLFANAWFDGFGGFVLPRVTESEASRRAGQLLLGLGLVPTALVLAGIGAALSRLRARGWDDTLVAMLLATAAMAAVVVQGTRTVPTHAAVKATYLMPVSVAFSVFLALGFDLVRRRSPAAARAVVALCGVLALASAAVFTHGLVIDERGLTTEYPNAVVRNMHGVVYAAAGWDERARALFESSAREDWPLAHENLAHFAFEEGRDEEALAHLLAATRGQQARREQANPWQREYLTRTLAEYASNRAVILHRLGRSDEALAAARESVSLFDGIPEAHYDLAWLLLASAHGDVPSRAGMLVARASLARAVALDGAFREAQVLLGVADVLAGDCPGGVARIREGLARHPGEHRAYPMITGPGDQNGAALGRRRRIAGVPPGLEPSRALDACGASADAGANAAGAGRAHARSSSQAAADG